MDVRAEETWSWMLLAEGEALYLSVVCGTVGIFEIAVRLEAGESGSYAAEGRAFLETLAAAIRFRPSAFRARDIRDFHEWPGAAAAIAAWRRAADAKP